MKVGANTMSFMWKTSAREALETLAREGYRRFELMAQRPHFDPFMERAEALAFGRFLRDAGLTVETINMPSLDQNLASASPEMRDYTVRLFERLIGIAETIGASGIIVVTGRVNPLISPVRADLEGWFDEAFERVLGTAERTGVRLLLENIPMGVYPRADQLIAFAERIDSPLVGVCYDIANAHFIGEDTAEGLRQVRSRLGSFTCPILAARPGGTTRSGRAAAISPGSARRCARSATRRRPCWRSCPAASRGHRYEPPQDHAMGLGSAACVSPACGRA